MQGPSDVCTLTHLVFGSPSTCDSPLKSGAVWVLDEVRVVLIYFPFDKYNNARLPFTNFKLRAPMS